MYNLILCSSFSKVSDKLRKQKRLPESGSRIGFIPNAADTYIKPGEPYPIRIIDDLEALKCLGYEVSIIDLLTIDEEELKLLLSGLNGLLVGGGNTFRLLHLMKKSGLIDLIRPFVREGKYYMGSSAGSCIAAPDIAYVQFADDPKVVELHGDYEALSLVSFGINPHFSGEIYPKTDQLEYEFVYKQEYFPIITLQDDQAILANLDGTLQFVL